jgi:hypothetical protein
VIIEAYQWIFSMIYWGSCVICPLQAQKQWHMHWITLKQKQSLTTDLITLVNIIPFTHVIFILCKFWILCWARPPYFELHVSKHAHHVSHSRHMSAKLFSTKWDLNPIHFQIFYSWTPTYFLQVQGSHH